LGLIVLMVDQFPHYNRILCWDAYRSFNSLDLDAPQD
jgi:hypothetical protein